MHWFNEILRKQPVDVHLWMINLWSHLSLRYVPQMIHFSKHKIDNNSVNFLDNMIKFMRWFRVILNIYSEYFTSCKMKCVVVISHLKLAWKVVSDVHSFKECWALIFLCFVLTSFIPSFLPVKTCGRKSEKVCLWMLHQMFLLDYIFMSFELHFKSNNWMLVSSWSAK